MPASLMRQSAPEDLGDHARGPSGAPVTMVVYGDYECPYTKLAMAEIEVTLRYDHDLARFVYRQFPLEKHPHAMLAALAAEAAGLRGLFWEMHELLFANQDRLSYDTIHAIALELGIESTEWPQLLEHRKVRAKVERDVQRGIACGTPGTPTFCFNGRDQLYGRHDPAILLEHIVAAARTEGAVV